MQNGVSSLRFAELIADKCLHIGLIRFFDECRYRYQLALKSTKEYGFLRFLAIQGKIAHIC
jgi:hypothetical protein